MITTAEAFAFTRRGTAALALLLWSLVAAGCQMFPKSSTVSSREGWEHSYFYNHPSPYPKLFVEIDYVEGTGPSARELRALEDFLKRFCAKPGGITIKLDNAIPKAVARSRGASSLALEHMNGPPDDGSAFLYIIFYNTRLRGIGDTVESPSFSPRPVPTIYMDRGYRIRGNLYGGTFARAVLLHETGHALGLCAQTNHHGKEGHCTNGLCLMYPSVRFNPLRILTLRNPWENTSLCADCVAELEINKTVAPTRPDRFWNGYSIRTETGYHVLELPGMTYVHFGDRAEISLEQVRELRAQCVVDKVADDSVWTAQSNNFNPWDHLEAIARISEEQDETLRRLAQRLFENILTLFEGATETERDGIREGLSDEFIATARQFPELQTKFIEVRDRLARPAVDAAKNTDS